MFVVDLKEVRKDSILTVGGKGANLGEMVAYGFPVPQGFCITSSAYDTYIVENKFSNKIEKVLAAIYAAPEQGAKLSAELIEHIAAGEMPQEIYSAIEKAYAGMGNQVRVAVRSSATAEDLPEASFAGQQETYLNIQGLEAVIYAVKCCFASLWTERAIAYRKKTKFDQQKVSLAIVVQEMIEGEVSGVLFTVNPISNEPNEMMINASYGLGEAVVSGMVTPDTFVWDTKRNSLKQKTLGSKEVSIVYRSDGGTVQKINENELKSSYCLSDKQFHALTLLAQKIEAHYGAPQDIEWTIKDNEFYILQSRGITTLKPKEQSPSKSTQAKQNKRERMMMNNLIEHCPTPLYPLDFEPFYAVSRGKTETMKELGIQLTDDALVLKDTGEFEVHGPTIKITPRILLIPFRIKPYMDFNKNTLGTQKVFTEVCPTLNKIEALDKRLLSADELLEYLNRIMGIADQIIYIRFRYNIYPSFAAGKFINDSLKKLSPSVSQYDLFSNLHYRTWDMNLAISKLAALVNQDISLRDIITNLSKYDELEEPLTEVAKKFPQFGSLYAKIIKEYGWKSTSTYYAFSASSWNENKAYFITLLRIAMTQPEAEPESQKYETICRQIKTSFSKPKADKLLKTIHEIRTYHQNREESLYLLEQCYGISRMIVKEVARRFPKLFLSPDDVLFLTLKEVALLRNSVPDTIRQKIKIRKEAMIKNQALWDEMAVQTVNSNTDQLKGISGNIGVIKGKVCIIQDISEFEKLKQGDILVCKYTDPVWTPLFILAKAVVSDTGGPLSHSAIVAREYNIPAVLGCGNATKVLSDGQEILVDGDKGIVYLSSSNVSHSI